MINRKEPSFWRRQSLFFIAVASIWLFESPVCRAAEQHFDVLTIGTKVYSNVTVTTKSKTYVFLMHSAGLANIKVSSLSPELKQELGYNDGLTVTKVSAANAVKWAEAKLNKLDLPPIVAQARTLKRTDFNVKTLKSIKLNQRQLISIIAGIFLFWLIRCACHASICRKAGSEPGALIWLPIVQLIPILKAAKMSTAWMWAILFAPAMCVMYVIWCFKIASARGKSAFTGFLLLIPIINILPFLYLALSAGVDGGGEDRPKKSAAGTRVMSLEAA